MEDTKRQRKNQKKAANKREKTWTLASPLNILWWCRILDLLSHEILNIYASKIVPALAIMWVYVERFFHSHISNKYYLIMLLMADTWKIIQSENQAVLVSVAWTLAFSSIFPFFGAHQRKCIFYIANENFELRPAEMNLAGKLKCLILRS